MKTCFKRQFAVKFFFFKVKSLFLWPLSVKTYLEENADGEHEKENEENSSQKRKDLILIL
jgi:hypothetical protein